MESPVRSYNLLFAIATLFHLSLWAGPQEEAQTLKDEAVAILRSGSGLEVDPRLYAQCVVKLERAMDLLESGGAMDSELAQEVSAALFWARRFSTISIIDEVKRQRNEGDSPSRPSKPVDPPKVPANKPRSSIRKANSLRARTPATIMPWRCAGPRWRTRRTERITH
jgi:hypothetical protein